MSWPRTVATHYHAQLGLPDKGRAIKGLVFCFGVWLGSMVGISFSTCTRFLGLVPDCGQAIELKFPKARKKHNIPLQKITFV